MNKKTKKQKDKIIGIVKSYYLFKNTRLMDYVVNILREVFENNKEINTFEGFRGFFYWEIEARLIYFEDQTDLLKKIGLDFEIWLNDEYIPNFGNIDNFNLKELLISFLLDDFDEMSLINVFEE